MEQYHPDAHVGKPRRGPIPSKSTSLPQADANMIESEGVATSEKSSVRYEDINRSIRPEEVSSVRRVAEDAGLWRFCDPPKHDGFNI
jgi:putative pyruvate formate lyase activating enzyme